MTWFKVDDNLAFHQKTMIAGNAAMGLWVRAGSWCGQQLADGFVPEQIAGMLGTHSEAESLVSTGLWTRVEGGYQFHQWQQHQPTRAEVEKRREQDRERKAEWRAAKASQRDSARTDGVTPAGVREESALPVPSRPDPTRPDDYKTSRSGQETLQQRNADKTDLKLPAIITDLKHYADIEADETEAKEWAEYVTAHAKQEVRDPTAYVLSSLYNSTHEVIQWFDRSRRNTNRRAALAGEQVKR